MPRFFGGFTFFGVFLVTPVLLAIIVDGYWEFSKRKVKQERKKERMTFAKAWNIIDVEGTGSLLIKDRRRVRGLMLLARAGSSGAACAQ